MGPLLSPAEAQTACIACHSSTPDGLFVGITASLDPNDGGAPASVDMRSEARQGRSDFGKNAERVRKYMAALKAAG